MNPEERTAEQSKNRSETHVFLFAKRPNFTSETHFHHLHPDHLHLGTRKNLDTITPYRLYRLQSSLRGDYKSRSCLPHSIGVALTRVEGRQSALVGLAHPSRKVPGPIGSKYLAPQIPPSSLRSAIPPILGDEGFSSRAYWSL
ncbi:hypothetical protein TYRP_022618 [Tyrophagus putrescentiae]|nr:hypothetical protein TYRP_022618 [Tyrophagus putrescentiae]